MPRTFTRMYVKCVRVEKYKSNTWLQYVNVRLLKAGYNVRFLDHALNVCFSKGMLNICSKSYVKRMVFDSYV